ncbi:MAG: M64 family metallopeptidase [Bacteriovoracaceae bacterium]
MRTFLLLCALFTSLAFADSDECVKIRSSKNPDNRSINIVFVASGFLGKLDEFESSVKDHWKEISAYEPFSDQVETLNVWIVKASLASDGFCSFSNSIERLTKCNSLKGLLLANKCTNFTNRQVVIIHNTDRYGGSGGAVAAATNHPKSARVIVHELGHSLFNLADEYEASDGSLKGPNCAPVKNNCSSWQDLIDAGLATCQPGCPSTKRLMSYPSVMKALEENSFGHVNHRHICCKFKKETGEYPGFCDQYATIGEGLDRFCR